MPQRSVLSKSCIFQNGLMPISSQSGSQVCASRNRRFGSFVFPTFIRSACFSMYNHPGSIASSLYHAGSREFCIEKSCLRRNICSIFANRDPAAIIPNVKRIPYVMVAETENPYDAMARKVAERGDNYRRQVLESRPFQDAIQYLEDIAFDFLVAHCYIRLQGARFGAADDFLLFRFAPHMVEAV